MAGACALALAAAGCGKTGGDTRPRVDVSGAVTLDGESWLPVRGVRLRRDGTEVGPVQVLVRAAQLPPGVA